MLNRCVALVAVLVSLVPAWAKADETKRPNLVFLVTDDQRWDMMGNMTPLLHTPEMDKLVREGTRFENAFVTTPICAASRASLFTGLVERTHGFTFRTPPLAKEYCESSYPARLRAAGYRTGFVGKFGVGVAGNARREMFDSFVSLNRSPYMKKQSDGTLRHVTDITADKSIEFIEGCSADTPFCLSVSFNAPHAEDGDKRQYIWPPAMDSLYKQVTIPPAPLSQPEFFASQPKHLRDSMNRDRWYWRFDTPEKYQRMTKGYYRMISGVDAAIGRIRAALAERGFAENTVIVLMGDNGYFIDDRGFAGKWLPYNQSIRVPLVFFDPRSASTARGGKPTAMALNIDIAPTLLDLAGVEVPKSMQGRSLVDVAAGKTPSDWRKDFFCEHLMEHHRINKHEGVRGERYRYARYFDQDPVYEELFDLQADPLETKNLVGEPAHAETLTTLRARCDELRDSYGGAYQSPPKFRGAKVPGEGK